MGNKPSKFLDPIEGVPKGACGGDGGQVGAMSLSVVLSRGAVECGMFESFFFFFASGAQCGLVFVDVGGLGGKVALS